MNRAERSNLRYLRNHPELANKIKAKREYAKNLKKEQSKEAKIIIDGKFNPKRKKNVYLNEETERLAQLERNRIITKNDIKKNIRAIKNKNKKKKKGIRTEYNENALKDINYKDFLKTDYWRFVRKIVLKRDKNKCQMCGRNNNLHIHHLTYKNHFNEHKNLNDLITLCDQCHSIEHSDDGVDIFQLIKLLQSENKKNKHTIPINIPVSIPMDFPVDKLSKLFRGNIVIKKNIKST